MKEQEREETQEERMARRNQAIEDMKKNHASHDFDCEGCQMLYFIWQLQKEKDDEIKQNN